MNYLKNFNLVLLKKNKLRSKNKIQFLCLPIQAQIVEKTY